MTKEEEKARLNKRTVEVANYIIKNRATTRQAAHAFNLNCGSISRDMSKRLKDIDLELYYQVKKIFEENTLINRESIREIHEIWRNSCEFNHFGRAKNRR